MVLHFSAVGTKPVTVPPPPTPPLVLTVAGFDPTSGAGITADIKTFAANQTYGLACITCHTVQNTQGARSYHPVPAAQLEQELECLLSELSPRAAKLGMLGTRATVEVVVRQFERHPLPWLVLDPIYAATSGVRLCDDDAWKLLQKRLLPLASVVTPNLAEAEALTGLTVSNRAEMEAAAERIHQMGPRYVVIKGGHLERPIDLVFDGVQAVTLAADRVRTGNTHGTGCTFSAAIAANLASGKRLLDAVVLAKAYLTAALKQSYALGPGPGPLNHLYRLQESLPSRNVDPAPLAEFTTR